MGPTAADLGAVGETALTPLYAKAMAAEIVPELGLSDPLAADLLARIPHVPDRLLKDRTNMLGVIHRTLAIDEATRRFAASYPGGQIVSVGIGLCTRHSRMAAEIPKTVDWIGVDTADVIRLRRAYLAEDPVRLITASIINHTWTAQTDSDRPTLVIAEGVLMYLDPAELAAFLWSVRDSFGSGTQLVADYFHPRVALSGKHPIVRATGAQFRSGARNGEALAALVPGYKLLRELPVMEHIGVWQRVSARSFTAATRGGRIYSIAHLQVTGQALAS